MWGGNHQEPSLVPSGSFSRSNPQPEAPPPRHRADPAPDSPPRLTQKPNIQRKRSVGPSGGKQPSGRREGRSLTAWGCGAISAGTAERNRNETERLEPLVLPLIPSTQPSSTPPPPL